MDMRYVSTYSLTAFDADSGKQLFQWPNIADAERIRPTKNATIIDLQEQHWLVVGVLDESTASDWRIDVKKVIASDKL